jgi:hypothetical protein
VRCGDGLFPAGALRRRAVPLRLWVRSPNGAALRRMETVALDESVRIPGTNASVGIDPILGVVPAAGDLVSAGISPYIIAEAANLGGSRTTLLRMIATIGIDVVGGSIPYVGTLFDAFWKANRTFSSPGFRKASSITSSNSRPERSSNTGIEWRTAGTRLSPPSRRRFLYQSAND